MLTKYIWSAIDGAAQDRLLQRPTQRSAARIEQVVRDIVEQVGRHGDTALREITARLDRVEIDDFRVSQQEIDAAFESCEAGVHRALTQSRDNVSRFHLQQLCVPRPVETVPGVCCERRVVPLAVVGLYVPAGNAPLPSSLIMQAVPAKLAGCERRILCTPPQPGGGADPTILAAARLCGISEIYKIGGAQAVAAMASGTETVPRVDKIFGPGNAYVAAAKRLVAQRPDGAVCDVTAGPSEVLVVADSSANPAFVAADLLAQAEHGVDSQVLLVTDDEKLAESVPAELQRQLRGLSRANIARESLVFSSVILVETIADAFTIVNRYAPEHLILQLENPRRWLDCVRNAGSIFLGAWTPEALGDYCSGTNHVLPTGGHARASSGLGVADFQKSISVQEASPAGLQALAPTVTTLAQVERLDAHAQSVNVRLQQLNQGAA